MKGFEKLTGRPKPRMPSLINDSNEATPSTKLRHSVDFAKHYQQYKQGAANKPTYISKTPFEMDINAN